MAIANENASRPQPCSNDSGVRNWPSAERGPNAMSEIAQPTAISTAGVRQEASFSGAVAVDMATPGSRADTALGRAILSGSTQTAKTKVRDGSDLPAAWLHGRSAKGV